MRPLNTLMIALALGVAAAPAFADPPARAPAAEAAKANKPKQSKAKKAEKAKQRQARLVEAMKKEGISEAKAKRVVEVIKKFKTEMRGVRTEMKSARGALRDSDQSNDKAARERIAAAKQKREGIKQRRQAEIAKVLTPAEQAKLKTLMERHRKHAKGKRGKAQGKPHQKRTG